MQLDLNKSLTPIVNIIYIFEQKEYKRVKHKIRLNSDRYLPCRYGTSIVLFGAIHLRFDNYAIYQRQNIIQLPYVLSVYIALFNVHNSTKRKTSFLFHMNFLSW